MRSFRHHHRRRRVLRATSLYFIILCVLGGCVLWVRTQSTRTDRSAATIAPNSKPAGQQNPEKSTEPSPAATAVARQPMVEGRSPTPAFANTGIASSSRKNSSWHRRHTAPRATVAQNDVATQGLFVELPSFALRAPNEELRIIRVNMPISSLRLLGAPIDEDSMTRRVTTDLLIGSDGTPYAVRLVM